MSRPRSTLPCLVLFVLLSAAGCEGSEGSPVGGADDNLNTDTPSCDGDDERDVCTAFCRRFCQNQVLHCYASECAESDCDEGSAIMDACLAAGGVGAARELCTAQLEIGCEAFGKETAGTWESSCFLHDPECVQAEELGCSNTCGRDDRVGAQLAGNGVCEDGHPDDAESSACDRGTDCDDCGAHACAPPLADCTDHPDCCGYYGSGALCVAPREGSQPYCVQICDDERPCPDGFACEATDETTSVCMLEESPAED